MVRFCWVMCWVSVVLFIVVGRCRYRCRFCLVLLMNGFLVLGVSMGLSVLSSVVWCLL